MADRAIDDLSDDAIAVPSTTSARSGLAGPVLMLAVAVGSLALAVVAFGQGAPTMGWLLGAIGVAITPLALDQLATLQGRVGVLRLRRNGDGVLVVGSNFSRLVDLAAAVVFVVALAGSLAASVDAPGAGGLETIAPILFLAGLAVLTFAPALRVVARRRRNSRLRLHRDGVEASGADGRATFEWELFTGVRCGPGPNQLVLLAHDGTTVELPAVELRSDPQLVARLIEHYRVHRRDRPELADARVLQRVAENRLTEAPHD